MVHIHGSAVLRKMILIRQPGARRIILLSLILCGFWVGSATASEYIAVIVGKNPPDIAFTRSNLTDIFLKRILVDDKQSGVTAINLSSSNPLRTAFSLSLLGKRPDDLQQYWTEKYFLGVSPPYTVDSQESMLRFISSTSGSIGYVVSCRVDGRVHVVAELPVPVEMASRIHQLCDHPRQSSP
jgi:hypothetical protein